jgi:hypothetical protein
MANAILVMLSIWVRGMHMMAFTRTKPVVVSNESGCSIEPTLLKMLWSDLSLNQRD